jgi:sarcosine oxidase subunit alpha
MVIKPQLLIVGGGPAGLSAAVSAVRSGVKDILLLERNPNLGGQLIKQTHMFFGSQKQYASYRGFDISNILLKELKEYPDSITIKTQATVLGIYEDGMVSAQIDDDYVKILPQRIILATGANEKMVAFMGNDLPGVYGAGAVQTLMNVYGVKPANKVLMVGAGNIGLIVSYQLLQAGVDVAAVVTTTKVSGYQVHASKLARMGVPIMAGYTIKEAKGDEFVTSAVISKVDKNREFIEGTEIEMEVDAVCISTGLSPLVELLSQVGGQTKYVTELGGYVPLRNKEYRTTVPNIFVAGDITGIEEASSAMVEGSIAGMYCAKDLGYEMNNFDLIVKDLYDQLDDLRKGPHSTRLLEGIGKVIINE